MKIVFLFGILMNSLVFASVHDVDVEISMWAVQKEVEIFKGFKTNVWSYEASLIKGPAGSLVASTTYLGPTLHLRTGQKVSIHFNNQLPETSIIHWHGLDIPSLMDGHPRDAVGT
ncbi:MAG: multicopper oxidase domain-containing protein, partial [Bdellovibrionales bacterium]